VGIAGKVYSALGSMGMINQNLYPGNVILHSLIDKISTFSPPSIPLRQVQSNIRPSYRNEITIR
jgi:hypothetical protein